MIVIYIGGDLHGNLNQLIEHTAKLHLKQEDILILLGDVGINYTGGMRDFHLKQQLCQLLPVTYFCIRGNHENDAKNLSGYHEESFHEGSVYVEEEFPRLKFAKDGEIYDFDGKKCMVIGGAYSVDKWYRLRNGYPWFEDEQPDDTVKAKVRQSLEAANWNIDVFLTHTCPLKYEPKEVFLQGIDQSLVDKTTEMFLDEIEHRCQYQKWYCGHYHTEKEIDDMIFLYKSIQPFT